nr:agamous-like MADS-box protein AGL62 [Tanacetum cinerariifolium]
MIHKKGRDFHKAKTGSVVVSHGMFGSSQGKQKIEIKKIKAKSSRQVTFSRRRAGLFKKAVELCVLIGAKVTVLVKSPGGKVYMLGEDLIDDCNSEQESNIGQLEEIKKDAVDELKMNSNIPEKLGLEEMKKN